MGVYWMPGPRFNNNGKLISFSGDNGPARLPAPAAGTAYSKISARKSRIARQERRSAAAL